MDRSGFDVAIVGNGVIGTLSAIQLSEYFPSLNIALIGNDQRKGSASVAAGAMINVYGEIDYHKTFDDYIARKLKLGLTATKKWHEFSVAHGIHAELFTADDTIIYKKEGGTRLETCCFDEIKKCYLEEVSDAKIDKIEAIKKKMKIGSTAEFLQIYGEAAISPPFFFSWADKFLTTIKNISYFPSDAIKVKDSSEGYSVILADQTINARSVVVAAGAWTTSLLDSLSSDIIGLYYGVGSAIEMKVAARHESFIPERTVVRTPNRGNTCGIHVVPRGNGEFYLGAGSYISMDPNFSHRMGTIKYLINCLEEDFFEDIDKLQFNPVLGFRPMSFDGKPMVGTLKSHPNVFVASGTKRDGLTYATCIVEEICSWVSESSGANLFEGWEPERKPISYGDKDFAIDSYVENKLAGLQEHRIVAGKPETQLKEELFGEAEKFHKAIQARFKLPGSFGVHPEVLNIFQ